MNDKWKNFIQKNFTLFHVAGIMLGWGFALIYWYKIGQTSENILKNNPFLISLWGIALGYITVDLIFSSRKRDDENNDNQ